MNNITIEDYKTAIRAKYEVAIKEDVSGILSDPTPAQLRDFYLRIFERGVSTIDEEIMKIFLEANENFSLKKTIENCKIGKFKPIISFLEGGNTDNKSRIEMAAILVDFELRPYKKFQVNNSDEEKELIEDLKKFEPLPIKEKKDLEVEGEDENFNDIEDSNVDQNSNEDETQEEKISSVEILKPVGIVGTVKRSFFEKYRRTAIATAIIFGLIAVGTIGTVIYFEFLKKGCIQWSGDHYDEVSCNMEMEGIGTFNSPETYDDRIINLRRIKVCDTTAFFKNNKAVVWYAKVGDSVEFFNTHGMHPENGKALRPVTQYIINKYVKKH
ncbi:hypothetical protein EV144_103262 [Flavobacterium sp. 270]|uniref:hypothetical protein n=1 Tax=Flavobacterium sp. 270 TaxID=2512114 RepID=UPI001064637F|nr:hypothetical protein [Flavobacterium sp. 270]TDW48745.1 hypothetical protein EV144_103262 [Flavobacterium sp. 270]